MKDAKNSLENLSKQAATLKSSGIEGNNLSNDGGPAKKRKTGKKAGGNVVASMKVADLSAEAIARGMDVKSVSRMNKTELVNALVVGSMCITKTDAWAEVVRVRERFESERKKAAEEEQQHQDELRAQWKKQEIERLAKRQAERDKKRAAEISSQAEKHVHDVPKVHACKLAKTDELMFHEEPRQYNSRCSECRSYESLFTCEKCNFDICADCYKEKTMTAAEKKAEAKRKAELERQRREAERQLQEAAAERRRMMEEEEEKRRKKWDPKAHFKPDIVNPSHSNLNPNDTKGYVVWSSDGYDYDGFHSYEGPPDKVYDSTWSTKAKANERARYLFHWRNPWGHGPDHMIEEEEIHESKNDGLVKYVASPPDSSTWTVTVIPAAAFAHLDNVRKFGDHYDNDYGPTARDLGYGSFF